MNSGPILTIQICRFSNQGGELVKDETLVSSTQSQSGQYLIAPITNEDEVSFINKYSLIATINRSGTLSKGHYWACIKDLHLSCWYSWNEKLVFNVEGYLNNTTSYILFTAKCNFFLGSTKISFCKGVLSFQTLSLGVTIPHITPVLYGN